MSRSVKEIVTALGLSDMFEFAVANMIWNVERGYAAREQMQRTGRTTVMAVAVCKYLEDNPTATVVAVGEVLRDRARAFAKRLGIDPERIASELKINGGDGLRFFDPNLT